MTDTKEKQKASVTLTSKTMEDLPVIPESIVAETTDTIEKAHALRDVVTADSLSLSKGMGMTQAFTFMRDFSDLARLKWLKERKESKDYKGLQCIDSKGELCTLRNFEDLCGCMGLSYRKVSEDLLNLATFGEEFMKSASRIGLGYRDLRKLRALPEADIKELEATDDPDALRQMADDLLRQTYELKKKTEEQAQTLKAREQMLQEKDKTINSARAELIKLKSLTPDEQVIERGRMEAELIQDMDTKCAELSGLMTQLLGTAARLLESESPATALYPHERITLLCEELAERISDAGINADFHDTITGDKWRGEPKA